MEDPLKELEDIVSLIYFRCTKTKTLFFLVFFSLFLALTARARPNWFEFRSVLRRLLRRYYNMRKSMKYFNLKI